MITVSIPTRGRHESLAYVVGEYLAKADDPKSVQILIATDDDEPVLELLGAIISRAPREDYLGAKWNRAIKEAPADVYLAACDDLAVLTQGWDTKIQSAAKLFPDGVGVIYYGEAQGASLPMQQAVTHGWADGFGGIYPEHFPYWFHDMWLDELAMMTGRMVWVDIEAASIDGDGRGKTKGLRDVRFWNQFFDLTRPVRERQADHAIDEFYKDMPYMAWRLKGKGRTAMRSMFAERSKYIHMTSVEAEAKQSIDAPENDRYLRIKRAAELYLQSLYSKAA